MNLAAAQALNPSAEFGQASLAVKPGVPNSIFFGAFNRGVFRSVDGGQSWTAPNLDLDGFSPQAFAFDPHDPNTMYVNVYKVSATPAAGIYRNDANRLYFFIRSRTGEVATFHVGRGGGQNTAVTGINASGTIVGNADTNSDKQVAFLRRPNGGVGHRRGRIIAQAFDGCAHAATQTPHRGEASREVFLIGESAPPGSGSARIMAGHERPGARGNYFAP